MLHAISDYSRVHKRGYSVTGNVFPMWSEEEEKKKAPSCSCPRNTTPIMCGCVRVRVICFSATISLWKVAYSPSRQQVSAISMHQLGQAVSSMQESRRKKRTGRSVCCLTVFSFSLPPTKPFLLPVQALHNECVRPNHCSSNEFNEHNWLNKWWMLNNLVLL